MNSLQLNDKLLTALESGNFETALPLLSKDGPLITIGPEEFTPLHYACRHGEAEVTRCFLTHYLYKVISTSIHGHTPAHIAAKYGHVETLKVLVAETSDCECSTTAAGEPTTTLDITSLRDHEGNTPLHLAAACGHLPVVQYLTHDLQCIPLCTNMQMETPLHLAAEKGHLNVVEYLVSGIGCSPSPVDEHGRSPLYTAAGCGQLAVVKYLVEEKSCDPMVGTSKRWKTTEFSMSPGRTPLHTASREGHFNVVHYLVNTLKCDPSCRDEDDVTPIILASQNGHLAIVHFLIEHEADPSLQASLGRSSLHMASFFGHLPVVKFLVDKVSDHLAKDKNGYTPVAYAASAGRLDVLKFFIEEKRCNPMIRGRWNKTLVHTACEGGHLDIIEYLIHEHQVEPSCPDEFGKTPLHIASAFGHLAVVLFLTTKGSDPHTRNKFGNTSITTAAINGRLEILKFFITKKHCDPKVRGQYNRTLVHSASEGGHHDTILYLINEHQVDHSCRDNDGETALHLAAQNGHLPVVTILVEKHCDPLSINKHGNTPVSIAALHGWLEVLKLFFEKERNPIIRDKVSRSALYMASQSGHLEIVKYFIGFESCNPLVRGSWDENLLHNASEKGHLEIVEFLINEHQIDPLCRNDNGDTPLHLATQNKHLHVVAFLVGKRCDPLATNKCGSTPVSIAALQGWLEALTLFSATEHYPIVRDKLSRIALGIAVQNGYLKIVDYFIDFEGCDPLARDQRGRTLLHYASENGHLDIVDYLIKKHQVNPSACRDDEGATPLHLASKNGHLKVVKFLVEEIFCDPFAKTTDPTQSTPMMLACEQCHNDIVLYLYSKGESLPKGYHISKPLLANRVKIFFIGSQAIGKSTLVKALSTEAKWFGDWRNVSGVALETAGVIPSEFESEIFGKVSFYDFAGHKEYYSSHEVVFERGSHPVVLLTVNVSEDDESICNNLRFWRHFLVNVLLASGCHAHIIIVGSHADLVPSRQVQEKEALLLANFELSPSLTVVDSVLLDCRKAFSKGISKLRQSLEIICKRVRIKLKIDYHKSIALSDFIAKHVREGVLRFLELYSRVLNCTCSIRDLEALRSSPEVLLQTCENLSVTGQIHLLGNQEVPEESWIVFQKEVVLSQVHGLLKHMTHSTDLGIVPISFIQSLIQKHTQDLSPKLAVMYMEKMVFCSEINPQALARIKKFPPESLHMTERYFFFPSLVRVDNPSQVCDWTPEESPTCTSSWHLKCTKPSQFFTPRFLQVLLIELACEFALKVTTSSPSLVEPKQGCSIWKNGIYWLDPSGIKVIVHVDTNVKSLTLRLECLDGTRLQCVHLRSTLIHRIHDIKMKTCKELDLAEYFIHPKYFDRSDPFAHASFLASKFLPLDQVLISLMEVANAVVQPNHKLVLSKMPRGWPFLSVEGLLHFEPYRGIGVELLRALHNPQNQHEVIKDAVFEKLAQALHTHWESFAIALNASQATIAEMKIDDRATDITKCFEVFTKWSGGTKTYSALRDVLDQYSIFRGRNILDLCSDDVVRHEQQRIGQRPDISRDEVQQQEPAAESSTPTDAHQLSPPPVHSPLTDSDIGSLLELTDYSPLGLESLLEVRTEVATVVAHSIDLGVALGLQRESTLQVIQHDNLNDVARQLTEIIAAWLKGGDQTSWRSLARALVATNVSCLHIARRIAERHPGGNVTLTPVASYSISETQFQDVDSSLLDDSSLDIVVEAIWELSHLWFHLGLVFGLTYGRLKAIQTECPRAGDCLAKVITSWLCLRDAVLNQGQPSWRTLVRALAHPLIGEVRLAKQFAEEHKVQVGDSGDATTP